MPTFEFTSPDGKNYAVDGPEGATKEQAFQMLQTQLSSAPLAPTHNDIPGVPGAAARMAAEVKSLPQQDNLLGKAFGAVEVPLTVATGVLGGLAGSLAGAGKTLTSGKYGTQAGIREGDAFGGKVAEALTYKPRTQSGGAMVQKIGEALTDSGIMGVPIPELNALARGARPAAQAASIVGRAGAAKAAELGTAGVRKLSELPRKKAAPLDGVGAAATPEETIRIERAAALPVPIKLTRGQASRTFKEQQFERETAKLPEGDPLRQRFAQQNEQVIQNIDAFIDETGAIAPDLRSLGRSVVDATAGRKAMKKSEVNQGYAAAREAGHMADEIDLSKLSEFIENNRTKAEMAPIITTVERIVKKHGKVIGGDRDALMNPRPRRTVMDLDATEDLRQAINKLAQPGTPNVVYGIEAKKLIDAATEGKGGTLYQQARRGYENYATEFKNRGVIDKMLRTKPGTKDRAVAFEDVLDHAVFKGPLDDVRHVRRTLQTAGPAGEQAWRELQGGTLGKIKKTILSNTARDQNGNSIVSPAKLDRLIENLDADGKLDFIYGKQGAQKIRDLNDLAKDVYTSPPGSVNHSNTSTALMAALDLSSSAFTGLPLPAATAINYGVKKFKSNSLKKKVAATLDAERATLPRRKP